MSAVRLRVPATSANLGPGFDALGLALGLYDEVEAELVGVSGGHSAFERHSRVEVRGEGAGQVPSDARHLVLRSMAAAFATWGAPLPPIHLRCCNRIPHQRGLGSSAGAIVAGIMLARALEPGALDDDGALALAARLEGHADNVAACLLGGLVITWPEGRSSGEPLSTDEGESASAPVEPPARAVRLTPHPALQAVVLVPSRRSETARMRGLLPASVPHADAAWNAGRSALLVHALTAAPDLLLPATEDRLHQPYRASAMPESAAVVSHLREAGIAGVVSGAGPSVLAVGTGDRFPDRVRESAAGRSDWTVHSLEVDHTGAAVIA